MLANRSQHLVPTDSRCGVDPTMLPPPPFLLSDHAVPSALGGGFLPARSSSEFLQQLFADQTYPYADHHGELDKLTCQILSSSPLTEPFLDDRFYAALPVQSAEVDDALCGDLSSSTSDVLTNGVTASDDSDTWDTGSVAASATNPTPATSAPADDMVHHHLVGAFRDVSVTETEAETAEFDSDSWHKLMEDIGQVPGSVSSSPSTVQALSLSEGGLGLPVAFSGRAVDVLAQYSRGGALADHIQFPILKHRAEQYLRVVLSQDQQVPDERDDCTMAQGIMDVGPAGFDDGNSSAASGGNIAAGLDHFVGSMMGYFQRLIDSFESRRSKDQADWEQIHGKLAVDLADVVNGAGQQQRRQQQRGGRRGDPGARKGASYRYSLTKRREALSPAAIKKLREWLQQHTNEPYPDEDQKDTLSMETGLTVTQINNWFINARRRILPKMLRVR